MPRAARSPMLRLFLALALPPPILSSCVALQSMLRQGFGTRRLETRPFKPHVTLARLRRPSNIEICLQGLAANTTAFRFEQVSLWSSKLGPAGSAYTELHTWTLGKGEHDEGG